MTGHQAELVLQKIKFRLVTEVIVTERILSNQINISPVCVVDVTV